MKLTRRLAVIALPLTFSLGFASTALADDEFCIALAENALENVDPALLGEFQITVNASMSHRFDPDTDLPTQVITPTNTAACYTIQQGPNWTFSISNTSGDKFWLGVHDPLVGELEVYNVTSYGAPEPDSGFAGTQFGDLSVASVQKGDDGVYRVIMTGSLLGEILEIQKEGGIH